MIFSPILSIIPQDFLENIKLLRSDFPNIFVDSLTTWYSTPLSDYITLFNTHIIGNIPIYLIFTVLVTIFLYFIIDTKLHEEMHYYAAIVMAKTKPKYNQKVKKIRTNTTFNKGYIDVNYFQVLRENPLLYKKQIKWIARAGYIGCTIIYLIGFILLFLLAFFTPNPFVMFSLPIILLSISFSIATMIAIDLVAYFITYYVYIVKSKIIKLPFSKKLKIKFLENLLTYPTNNPDRLFVKNPIQYKNFQLKK